MTGGMSPVSVGACVTLNGGHLMFLLFQATRTSATTVVPNFSFQLLFIR